MPPEGRRFPGDELERRAGSILRDVILVSTGHPSHDELRSRQEHIGHGFVIRNLRGPGTACWARISKATSGALRLVLAIRRPLEQPHVDTSPSKTE